MQSNQKIIMTGKNGIEIDSVICVKAFDENNVLLETSLGLVSIDGADLKIENFEKATTKILITGNIQGVYYVEKKDKKKGRL